MIFGGNIFAHTSIPPIVFNEQRWTVLILMKIQRSVPDKLATKLSVEPKMPSGKSFDVMIEG
jgi:hypothetical protein